MKGHRWYILLAIIVALTGLGIALDSTAYDYIADIFVGNFVSYDDSFTILQSRDVFPLDREASEVVWVPEQSAFYTHGGDKGSGDGYVESDSGIYKYVPGHNPVKVADLPVPLHHIGFAYNSGTGLIYTYAGGRDFTGGGTQIYWFDPRNNATGVSAETFPYDSVAVSAEYSPVQKLTYLFGGFDSTQSYREVWKHDAATGSVTKSESSLVGGGFFFMATVYVEPEDAVYLIGGLDEAGNSRTEIYRFDCATEKITVLDATTPDNKTKGMGSYYDPILNAIVLAGGRDGHPWTGYTNRIWVLNLGDYSVKVLSSTLPSALDDLDGGYSTVNDKGYFMRVTPKGYIGYAVLEPYSCGNRQRYIVEVARSK